VLAGKYRGIEVSRQLISCALATAIALGAMLSLAAVIVAQGTDWGGTFRARFQQSTGVTYDDLKISGDKLIYKTFVFSEPRTSVIGPAGPFYSESDLTEKEATLTKRDIETLISLVKRTGFFSMPSLLGKEHGGRYYGTRIEFTFDQQHHAVLFKSSPDSGDKPQAFRDLEDALINLARSKTNLHPENNPWKPVVPNWDEIIKSHQRRDASPR